MVTPPQLAYALSYVLTSLPFMTLLLSKLSYLYGKFSIIYRNSAAHMYFQKTQLKVLIIYSILIFSNKNYGF